MTRLLIHRLASSGLLLIGVLTLVFVAVYLAPGEPTDRFTDPRIGVEENQRVRELYGLDRPLAAQYLSWLGAVVFSGDWGVSFLYRQPVSLVVAERLAPTVLLVGSALSIQILLGFGLGLLAARRPNGATDLALRGLSALTVAMPAFWIALLGVLVFSVGLGWTPAGNLMSTPQPEGTLARFVDIARHLVLPSLVLALPLALETSRYVRSALLDVDREPFVRGARARGVPSSRLALQRLRAAAPPVVQLLGATAPWLLSGAVVVETIFNWPGLGSAILRAAQAQDFPLLLAATALTTGVAVLASLVADLVTAWLDPRARP